MHIREICKEDTCAYQLHINSIYMQISLYIYIYMYIYIVVPRVDIWHAEGCPHDARKGGHVGDLLHLENYIQLVG